jgi:hypothetical protein
MVAEPGGDPPGDDANRSCDEDAESTYEAKEVSLKEIAKDLQEIKVMVTALVKRDRIVEMKTDTAEKRLERLQKEGEERKEEEADRDGFVSCVVKKLFVEKGFGFIIDDFGNKAFLHVSVMPGSVVPVVGSRLHAKLMQDVSRVEGGWKVAEAFTEIAWQDRQTRR